MSTIQSLRQNRTSCAGFLLGLMIILTILQDVFFTESGTDLSWVSGLFGWLAAALLVDKIKVAQRWQTATIGIVGLLLYLMAAYRGGDLEFGKAVAGNTGLIAMIAAVGFLRLIVNPGSADENLPVGLRAYIRTLIGVWMFGSVINISAPIIFADRLTQRNGLSPLASQSIVRVFTTCSGWSPFFGGMAVVITYVPEVNLGLVILLCLPFSLFGFSVVLMEGMTRYRTDITTFKGYPVEFSSLWVPALLAVCVVILSWLSPSWSVLTHISISALAVSIFGLKLRSSWTETARAVRKQVTEQLPTMINELSLFLVAGVLAAGLASVLASGGYTIHFAGFELMQATLLLAFIILIAIVGVHPVVTVSGLTPLILTLEPNPDFLATVYLLAWSLGTCASPLSGTHLVFQGRYGISSWKAAARNWPYVVAMYIAALPFLYWVGSMLDS